MDIVNRTPGRSGKKVHRKNKFIAKLDLHEVDWDKVEKIFTSGREFVLKHSKGKKIIGSHTKDILKLLAGGAVFSLSLVIPALPMALAPFIIPKRQFDGRYFNQSLQRLKKQKLVKIVEENGQTVVRITQEGRVRALRYKLSEIEVKKPKAWDNKWRVVIFDIPEKYKRVREIFRSHLKVMGFYMLQRSVWVHPYPCFDEIEFLRQIYKVGINVTYILAEKVEGSQNLKEYFHLGNPA